MRIKRWIIEDITGYTPMTTFYEDLGIAEAFGTDAVKDTYQSIFKEWGGHYQYLTELVMALNWKIWEHYETNPKLAELYDQLWRQADEYAMSHLKGDELTYFFRTTD